jgi:hypothetical protein
VAIVAILIVAEECMEEGKAWVSNLPTKWLEYVVDTKLAESCENAETDLAKFRRKNIRSRLHRSLLATMCILKREKGRHRYMNILKFGFSMSLLSGHSRPAFELADCLQKKWCPRLNSVLQTRSKSCLATPRTFGERRPVCQLLQTIHFCYGFHSKIEK